MPSDVQPAIQPHFIIALAVTACVSLRLLPTRIAAASRFSRRARQPSLHCYGSPKGETRQRYRTLEIHHRLARYWMLFSLPTIAWALPAFACSSRLRALHRAILDGFQHTFCSMTLL